MTGGDGGGDRAGGARAAKRALRDRLLAERRALPASVVRDASAALVAHLVDLAEVTASSGGPLRVLLYAADPDEPSLDALLDAPPDGWEVLLPRVAGDALEAVPRPPGATLVAGYRGVREPVGAAVDLADVDVALVPGVAFTPDGRRLGRGGGFYDRTLPRLGDAVRIGLCLERFVLPGLPAEDHDERVDLVVTDASVRRRGADDGARQA